ncbi:MAG: MPN551 family DNA-binding protein [Mycoplasmoidaceae bacterium]
MPFIKELNKDFFIRDNQIILSQEYVEKNRWKFKKITGSRLSSILGSNEWTSEVKSWAIMVGIFKDKMDETLSFVGNTIEPKVKQFAEEVLNKKYLSYSPAKIQWDIFKDNMVFGGIPDGEPINENNELDYPNSRMLEIKTTSIDSLVYKKIDNTLMMQKDHNNFPLVKEKNGGLKKWFNNYNEITISEDYCMQLSLYLYLRNIEKGLFVIAFLETKDYAQPNSFIPSKDNIKFVELDLNRSSFEEKIIYAKNWYENYIKGCKSPKITSNDMKWLREEGLS